MLDFDHISDPDLTVENAWYLYAKDDGIVANEKRFIKDETNCDSEFSANITVANNIKSESKTLEPKTVAALGTPEEGTICYVTDADSVSYRAIATGGGSEKALVMYDGTNWIYH